MTNALAAEPSAYLKSAAHQPVQWLPWGEEAFRRAQAEGKPILLDIGAVWCHWCHVMDGESYEDPEVAAILNKEYVCVKVDRDERPDVDARYQRAVQALTGQGGWPLTAFLTPAGEVFYGGTYFPPEQNPYGRPGFLTLLRRLADAWHAEQAKLEQSARTIREHIAESLNEAKAGVIEPALLDAAADQMARLFDVRYGGFGTAPKFPHAGACQFLLARWRDTGTPWQKGIVEKTLVGMATGGIRDHVGGGFHRYAVDERWIVPHFEKMSYDNSELLRAYLSAFQAFGTPLFKDTAAGIVDWVTAVLSDPAAAMFFTSQDADVQFGDDGGYWTWTPDEARAVLDAAEFAAVERVFDVRIPGEMPHDHEKNVLWLREEPADDGERALLRAAIAKLKTARDHRPAPYVDRTPYVNWNAMMAGAFLQAGAVLDRPECNTLALRVLERIWREAWSAERGMTHALGRAEPHGLLDDHVQAAAAFLDAYEAEGDTPWLERAIAVMHHTVAQHWDDAAGGFWDIARDRAGAAYLTTRAKPVQDSPTPSANGVAALVLARLWTITDQKEWRDLLDRHLAAFAGSARDLSLYGATLLMAIDWAVHPVNRITVAGPAGAGPACAMHLRALQAYRPRRVVIRTIAPQPAATVCVGTTCSLPVSEPAALAELLR